VPFVITGIPIRSQIHLITQTWLFVIACLISRSVQALGCSAYFTGASVILVQIWRRNMTFAMGVGEIFTGMGMISGPLLGGWLYQVFCITFFSISLLLQRSRLKRYEFDLRMWEARNVAYSFLSFAGKIHK